MKALAALLLTSSVAVAGGMWSNSKAEQRVRATIDALRAEIGVELPPGSTRASLEAFLKRRRLEHSEAVNGVVYAALRDVSKGLVIRTGIHLRFYLTPEGTLERYELEEIHTGL